MGFFKAIGVLLALFIVFLGIQQYAHSSTLHPQARLKKLSLHLRGVPPSPQDYLELQTALSGNQLPRFFQSKTDEYLKSRQHVGKMVDRLQELFKFTPNRGLPESSLFEAPDDGRFSNQYSTRKTLLRKDRAFARNSADIIFKDIAKKNLSWDKLLKTKKYKVWGKRRGDKREFRNDAYFYKKIDRSLNRRWNAQTEDPVQLKSVKPRDNRFAGVLTTLRFAHRYKTDEINQNRSRSAQIFRIFLCDNMAINLKPSEKERKRLLRLSLNKGQSQATQPGSAANPNVHASDPACKACHYKLDPLGRVFNKMTRIIMDQPQPGRLRFNRPDGTKVNIPLNGAGDLAQVLPRLPEYESCQVGHFWKWFIGNDIPLSPATRSELVTQFNQVGRRTNDFISYLVNRPEFYTGPKEAPAAPGSFQSVRATLASCNKCHTKRLRQQELAPPDLTQLLYGGTQELHNEWIERIGDSMDLPNDGKNPTMPPASANWGRVRTQKAVKKIKQWICNGAPDASGKKTVTDPAVLDYVCGP